MWEQGWHVVTGVDEVGKGAWAGPLTVGAQQLRVANLVDPAVLGNDRGADWCEAWAVGHASHAECDELGMSDAQRLATRRALDGLGVHADRVLVDGKWDFVGVGRSVTIVKGERVSLSIAAASILAKVTRDRMMLELDEQFPGYWFGENKGYPCHRHRSALQMLGPSSIHRRSWAFMDNLSWRGIERVVPDNGQGTLFV